MPDNDPVIRDAQDVIDQLNRLADYLDSCEPQSSACMVPLSPNDPWRIYVGEARRLIDRAMQSGKIRVLAKALSDTEDDWQFFEQLVETALIYAKVDKLPEPPPTDLRERTAWALRMLAKVWWDLECKRIRENVQKAEKLEQANKFLSTREASDRTGADVSTITRMCKSEKMQGATKEKGKWRIPESSLDLVQNGKRTKKPKLSKAVLWECQNCNNEIKSRKCPGKCTKCTNGAYARKR